MSKQLRKLNSNFQNAWAPRVLMSNTELTMSSKSIYIVMSDDYFFYMDQRQSYQPSNEGLSFDTGLSLSQVKRSLKQLETVGAIERVGIGINKKIMWRVHPVSRFCESELSRLSRKRNLIQAKKDERKESNTDEMEAAMEAMLSEDME